jgi:hypothetical protein
MWAIGCWGDGVLGRWGVGAIGRWVVEAVRAGQHTCCGPGSHMYCKPSGRCRPDRRRHTVQRDGRRCRRQEWPARAPERRPCAWRAAARAGVSDDAQRTLNSLARTRMGRRGSSRAAGGRAARHASRHGACCAAARRRTRRARAPERPGKHSGGTTSSNTLASRCTPAVR